MGPSIEIRLLGPLEVLVDGRQIELGGSQERALIAFLALHANRSMASDAIIAALWGDIVPPTAPEMVRTYVARARRRIGPSLQRRSGGYVLEVPPDAVDAARFEKLCEDGFREQEAGEHAGAAEILRRALALWRDTPLPELRARPGGSEEAMRLEELRLTAFEHRFEAALSLDRSAPLVPELEALVREYPYRERLRRDLMLALYRGGRQQEALECYLEGRRTLVDEIGIEPGRELQELHAAILRQDSALDPASAPGPPAHPPPAYSPPTDGSTSRRIRRLAVVGGCLVAVAAGAVAAILASTQVGQPIIRPGSLGMLDPRTGVVLASHPIGGAPGPIAISRGVAWVGDGDHQTVVALNPSTLQPIRRAKVGAFPYQMASNGSSVWVGDGFTGRLTRVDQFGRFTGPFPPQPRSTGRLALAYGAGAIWIGSQDGSLTALDPRSGRAITVTHGVGNPQAVAVSRQAVWIAQASSDHLLRVALTGSRVPASVPIGGAASGVGVGDGSVWAVTPEDGRLWRVDLRTGIVTASVNVGLDFSQIAVIDGKVWVAAPQGKLEQVDPAKNAVVRTLEVHGLIGGIAGGDGRLWVTVR